jgi:hypothetical protein
MQEDVWDLKKAEITFMFFSHSVDNNLKLCYVTIADIRG